MHIYIEPVYPRISIYTHYISYITISYQHLSYQLHPLRKSHKVLVLENVSGPGDTPGCPERHTPCHNIHALPAFRRIRARPRLLLIGSLLIGAC